MDEATIATPSGPQPGDLIPDFSGLTPDGRTVYRRDFKGRRHLILCFVAPLPVDERAALAAALAARHAACRAAGAEFVVFTDAATRDAGTRPADAPPYPLLADPTGRLHDHFGATATPLLLVADRYGEIVLRRPLAAPLAAALDEALDAADWLHHRCSL